MSRFLFEAKHQSGRSVMGMAEASSRTILEKELKISECACRAITPLPDAPPTNMHFRTTPPSAYYCMAWENMKGEPDWMHYMKLHHDEHHLTATKWLQDDNLRYCAFLPLVIPAENPPEGALDCIEVDRERALIRFHSPAKPKPSRAVRNWQLFGIFWILMAVGILTGALYQQTRWHGALWIPFVLAFIGVLVYLYHVIHSNIVMDLNRSVVRRGFASRLPFLSREWLFDKVDRLVVRIAYSEEVFTIRRQRLDSHILTQYILGLGDGKSFIPLLRFYHRLDYDRYKGVYYPTHRKNLMAYPEDVREALRVIGGLLRLDTIHVQSGRTEFFTTLNPDTALRGEFREELTGKKVARKDLKTPVSSIVPLMVFGLIWNGILVSVYLSLLRQLVSGNMPTLLVLLILTPFLGYGLAAVLAPLCVLGLRKQGFPLEGFKPDWHKPFSVQGNSIAFWGGAFHVIVGVWLAGTYLPPIVQACWEMRQWQPVPCEILQSDVTEFQRGSWTLYDLHVRYRYRVGDQEYIGDRLMREWEPSMFRPMIDSQAAQFPRGGELLCHVDLENPGQSVLSRFIYGTRRANAGFGSIFMFLGAVIMGLGGRRWIKANRPASIPFERPERILVWLFLFLGWVGIAASFLVTDVFFGIDHGGTTVGAASATNPMLLVFFGIIGLFLLGRFLYHVFIRWDKVIVVSDSDFHEMNRQTKKRKKGRDTG